MIPNITKNITTAAPSKSSQNSLMALAGFFAVVSALFFWFLVLPKSAELKTQQTQKDTLSNQEQGFSGQLKTLNSLVKDLQNHKQDNDTLDQDLPLDGKTFDLQTLVQNLANSVNVTVADINISGKNDGVIAGDVNLLKNPFGVGRTLQKIGGSVSVSGTFPQIEAFIKKVESSSRILDITDIEISAGQNSQLNLKLAFSAYYLAPQ